MSRLYLFLLLVSAFTLAGIGVIAMLSLGHYNWPAILGAGVIGIAGAFPIAWAITRRIEATDPKDSL